MVEFFTNMGRGGLARSGNYEITLKIDKSLEITTVQNKTFNVFAFYIFFLTIIVLFPFLWH